VLERCPRCREPLLTLNWSALKRCEACGGYVERDGSWVERREGDIRYAEAMAKDHPMTVAELSKTLRHESETFAEDLRELCHRHRRRYRQTLEERSQILGETKLGGGSGGYRERASSSGVRLEVRSPRFAVTGPHLGLMLAVGLVMCGAGYSFPESWGSMSKALLLVIGALFIMFSVGIGILVGIGTLIERIWPQTRRQRVRTIELRSKAAPLLVRTSDDEVHQLPIDQARVGIVRIHDGQSTSHVAFLHGPGLEAELARSVEREPIRRLVLRLEYVLGLTSAGPE